MTAPARWFSPWRSPLAFAASSTASMRERAFTAISGVFVHMGRSTPRTPSVSTSAIGHERNGSAFVVSITRH